jgi:Flp pilus assembly protein CpaB
MTILILAILVGLVAAYGIRGALTAQPPSLPAAPATTIVPLASADLPAGRTIVEGDLVLLRMTQQEMQQQPWGNSLASVMLQSDQFIGRTIKKAVARGGPFMTTDFYLQGDGPDLRQRLRPGYRAISVPVPFERGGYVPLGSNVDVLFRSTFRAGNEVTPTVPETTMVLVENAEVIAVEQITPASQSSRTVRNLDLRMSNTGPNEQQATTIVLAVKPEQANKIEAVRNHGEFTLLSRPSQETSFGGSPSPTTLEDVLGLQLEALLPEEPPPPVATEIYRRGQRQVNVFQLSGGKYVPASAATN